MDTNEKWLQWAVELQSLAQAGLTYGRDVYDKERYERIREISAEIVPKSLRFSSVSRLRSIREIVRVSVKNVALT